MPYPDNMDWAAWGRAYGSDPDVDELIGEACCWSDHPDVMAAIAENEADPEADADDLYCILHDLRSEILYGLLVSVEDGSNIDTDYLLSEMERQAPTLDEVWAKITGIPTPPPCARLHNVADRYDAIGLHVNAASARQMARDAREFPSLYKNWASQLEMHVAAKEKQAKEKKQ